MCIVEWNNEITHVNVPGKLSTEVNRSICYLILFESLKMIDNWLNQSAMLCIKKKKKACPAKKQNFSSSSIFQNNIVVQNI